MIPKNIKRRPDGSPIWPKGLPLDKDGNPIWIKGLTFGPDGKPIWPRGIPLGKDGNPIWPKGVKFKDGVPIWPKVPKGKILPKKKTPLERGIMNKLAEKFCQNIDEKTSKKIKKAISQNPGLFAKFLKKKR